MWDEEVVEDRDGQVLQRPALTDRWQTANPTGGYSWPPKPLRYGLVTFQLLISLDRHTLAVSTLSTLVNTS